MIVQMNKQSNQIIVFSLYLLLPVGSKVTRVRWLGMTSTCLSSSVRRGSHTY